MVAWQLFCVFSVTGDSQHLAIFLSKDIKQCPETFFFFWLTQLGGTWWGLRVCCYHCLLGRGQGCCYTSYNTQESPHLSSKTKKCPFKNAVAPRSMTLSLYHFSDHFSFEQERRIMKAHLLTQSCPTLATPWTVAHQAPLSMGFSRQEYWRGWVAISSSGGSS